MANKKRYYHKNRAQKPDNAENSAIQQQTALYSSEQLSQSLQSLGVSEATCALLEKIVFSPLPTLFVARKRICTRCKVSTKRFCLKSKTRSKHTVCHCAPSKSLKMRKTTRLKSKMAKNKRASTDKKTCKRSKKAIKSKARRRYRRKTHFQIRSCRKNAKIAK